jgi:hypothetical protein
MLALIPVIGPLLALFSVPIVAKNGYLVPYDLFAFAVAF